MKIDRSATAAAALLSASLLLAGCAAASGAEPPPAAGPAESITAEAPPTAPPAPGLESPDPAAVVEVPAAVDAPDPVALSVPSLGKARVVAVGISPDGQAQIPQDVSEVGWYQYGSAPGDGDGSVVLMGHRDSRGGAGVLFGLAGVPVGETLTVTGADGTSHRYAVTSNESLNKQVVPLADLFVRDGPAQLVLVSCGGAYVKAQGGYLDNVVLRAVKL